MSISSPSCVCRSNIKMISYSHFCLPFISGLTDGVLMKLHSINEHFHSMPLIIEEKNSRSSQYTLFFKYDNVHTHTHTRARTHAHTLFSWFLNICNLFIRTGYISYSLASISSPSICQREGILIAEGAFV